MKNTIFSKVLAEFIGTFFLVLTVVGSGIMGENLSDNLALTLLGNSCLLYTSPSPRDRTRSRMPSSA